MNDKEKIIESLKSCHDQSECGKCNYRTRMEFPKCLELLHNDILTILKEQEPVEPRFLHGDWVCDRCSGIVCWYIANPTGYIEKNLAKYCPQCGQPIKWD